MLQKQTNLKLITALEKFVVYILNNLPFNMQLETPTCNAINIQKLCLKHDLTRVATILTTTINSQSSEPDMLQMGRN